MVKCDEAASSTRLVLPYMFHLPGSEQDTASVYSTYKQRIDSMFDESRSCYSGAPNSSEDLRLQNNAVQAKIEKMFVEMARSASSDTHGKARVKMSSSLSSTGGRNFPVRYLGSVGLSQKVTSLEGLQEPLKDLYFKYRRVLEDKGPESNPWGRGTLEISNCGLKVSHRGLDGIGDIEKLNPFSTIAVWAAVKFLCRDSLAGQGVEYAFLPLIADPEAIDKGTLFKPLNKTEGKIITGTYSLNPLTHHSPMFAVVMRKMGMSRQLECHGFVCDCSEDAIVIAANLYQALMSTMPLRKSCDNKNKNTHKPSNKNGVSYVSIGGSTVDESNNDRHSIVGSTSCVSEVNNNIAQSKPKSYISNEISSPIVQNHTDEKARDDPNIIRANVIKIPPPVPVRPPRRNKKSSISSASEDGEEFFIPAPSRNLKENGRSSLNSSSCRIIQCDADFQQNFQLLGFCNTSEIPIRRTVSDGIQLATEYRDVGDILTKIAIPRSKSFLNAGGPFTRYSRRQKSGDFYTNESRGIGSSPLGFNELFAEFRVQEGLNSMDDILDAIIDAEGMSFNDLKPIYKEFLLKLAVTLTKDELYQRSKSIMRRQKKKLKRRNSCCKRNKTFVTGAGGLKRVFKRSVSKLRPSKTRLANFEFTSVLFPSGSIRESKTNNSCASLESSSISSCSTINYRHSRQVSSKVVGSIKTRLPRRLSNRRRYQQLDQGNTFLSRHIQQPSTSEDSDFFSMIRSGGTTTVNSNKKGTIPYGEMLNRSSSGYLTCSECSYDSESCTCTSADKCYCSLGEASGQIKTRGSLTSIKIKDASLSSCACDTDSCFGSDKCYCSGTPPHNNHHHHHHHHKRDHGKGKTKSYEKSVLPILKYDIKHHSINQSAPNIDDQVSVVEQLKQRGFAASESSLSRADSPTTAWRKNEVKLTMSKKKDLIGSIKSTKSLEFLHLESLKNKHSPDFWGNSNNKCSYRQFHKRMDVYEPVPNLHRRSLSSQSKNFYQQRRSYSSDNLALDYDLFTSYKSEKNKFQASAMNPSNDQSSASKVLVVSARDPRGRVIYMGASCRSDDDQSYTDKHSSITDTNKHIKKGKEKGTSSSACEALSVKKSAEIAALFSEVKLNQTKDNVLSGKNMDCNKKGDVFYNTLESPNCFLSGSTNHYLGSNLENSLGYLP